MSSWLDLLIDHYVLSFFISYNIFYFKVYFVWNKDCHLAFFWFPFAWNIFFHPFIFSLYVSLGLKSVSCRQYIYGSCFCIHSVSPYLLIGALIHLHLGNYWYMYSYWHFLDCFGFVFVGLSFLPCLLAM